MSRSCAFEERVARAARRGRDAAGLEAELADHLAGCPLCRDRLLVESALAELSAALPERPIESLPDPRAIWRRHRREAARRAIVPIRWAERLAWAGGAAGAAIGLDLATPTLRASAAGPLDTLARGLAGLADAVTAGLSTAPLAGQPMGWALLVAGGCLALGLAAAQLFSSLAGEPG